MIEQNIIQQFRKIRNKPCLDYGYFSGLVNGNIAITTDGVGTKTIIAQTLNKYDTIGIDCVAMNVNDLLCIGATPISMVDYISMNDESILEDIAKGLVIGADLANISIAGGEIAMLDHFDLVGTAVGLVDKLIIGRDVKQGDIIVGIESNGIHSNGLTLARQILQEEFYPELLKPTHIYVREVLEIINTLPVKALIHITGGGFDNLSRIENKQVHYVINKPIEVPEIFLEIRERGNISTDEMYKTFNMGIGFCIVISKEYVDKVIQICEGYNRKAFEIGYYK